MTGFCGELPDDADSIMTLGFIVTVLTVNAVVSTSS